MMELGNMIFGHSRGEWHIPRGSGYEEPLSVLLAEVGLDSYGHPGYDCAEFTVRPYDWDAECDCGAEAAAEKWGKAHPHKRDCYQRELNRRGVEGTEVCSKERDAIYKTLCKERGLPFPDGCAVHCDCGRDKAYGEWSAEHPHKDACRIIQPNFLHKPTGLSVMWYKYPLRDSYMSKRLSAKQWRRVMLRCLDAVRSGNAAVGRP